MKSVISYTAALSLALTPSLAQSVNANTNNQLPTQGGSTEDDWSYKHIVEMGKGLVANYGYSPKDEADNQLWTPAEMAEMQKTADIRAQVDQMFNVTNIEDNQLFTQAQEAKIIEWAELQGANNDMSKAVGTDSSDDTENQADTDVNAESPTQEGNEEDIYSYKHILEMGEELVANYGAVPEEDDSNQFWATAEMGANSFLGF